MTSESIYIFGLFCLVAIGEAAMKNYKGYKVLGVVPTTIKSQKLLLNLMSDRQLDFWTEPSGLGRKVDIMVGPSYLATLKKKLIKAHISYNISIDNVQKSIDLERQRFVKANGEGQFDIDAFNNLQNIVSWLQSLSNACPPGINCKVYSIGKTYDGNHIYVFKISKTGSGRKAYWIDATIHSREWISTSTILKIMNQLVTQGDEHAIELVQKYDWYFAPMLNPDGYVFTWTQNRLWRKNMAIYAGAICFGTDLNRNFDFNWGKDGAQRDPCEPDFCGPSAGSELETKAVSAELNRIGSSVVATLSLHSFRSVLAFPWGNTEGFKRQKCERTADHAELMRVADLTADAIQKTYNTQWKQGTICEAIYKATGSMPDYAKGVSGIKYAYVAELRGDSFIPTVDQIPLAYKEVYNGVVAMVKAIQS